MKRNTIKAWDDSGRQIYREPDGTTIEITKRRDGAWQSKVAWKQFRADAGPFETVADALAWARTERATMTNATLVSDVLPDS